jgi:hypothetical protein
MPGTILGKPILYLGERGGAFLGPHPPRNTRKQTPCLTDGVRAHTIATTVAARLRSPDAIVDTMGPHAFCGGRPSGGRL